MRLRQRRGNIDERLNRRGDPGGGVRGGDTFVILGARLVRDLKPCPHCFGKTGERRRHPIRHHSCALAAAHDDDADRVRSSWGREGLLADGDNPRPGRIAGDVARAPGTFGRVERQRNCGRGTSGDLVRSAHHRVLLMQHARDAELSSCEHRPNRCIAAKPDHQIGTECLEQ